MTDHPKLGSLFLMCNDVAQVEKFYGQILGIKVTGSAIEGYIDVDAGIHITFFKGDYELPIQKDWAWQPGYKGGTANIASWTIKFNDVEFRKALAKIKSEQVESLKDTPEWRHDSYWGYTVKDPMGNTIELYTVPKSKPLPPVIWK